jgi:hypothetical protein
MAIRYLTGVNIDSNTLFVDSANNRVGIGTASPSEKLHVTGIGRFDSYLQIYGDWSTTYPIIQLLSTKSGGQTWNIENGRNSNNLEFYAVGGLGTVFSIVHSTGNVGIGTTSPAAKLDVTGGSIQLSTSGSGVYFGPSSAAQIIGVSGASSYLALGTVGSERMRITSAGNVGIGTTSPTAKLHSESSTTSYQGFFYNTNTTGGAGVRIRTDYQNNASILLNVENAGNDLFVVQGGAAGVGRVLIPSGNVGIGTTSPEQKLTIQGGVNNVWSFSTNTSDQPGFVAADNTTFGTATNILYLKQYGSALTGTIFGNSIASKSIVASDGSASTGLIVGTFNAQPLIVGTNNSERMRITSAGNVGIGTTSPATKLDISGDHVASIGLLRLNSSASNISAQTYYIGGVYKAATYAATDNNFIIWGREGDIILNTTTSNTERVRITSAGNVGIGTTSPAARLQVAGSAAVNTREVIADFRNSSDSQRIDIRDENAATTQPPGLYSATAGYGLGLYAAAAGAPIILYAGGITNSEERMRILGTNGNVGIGTTSPAVKLQVQDGVIRATGTTGSTGQIDASPNFGAFRFFDGSTFYGGLGMGQWAGVGANADIVQYLAGGVNYYISNTTNPAFAVKSDGNVGIGTTSPAYPLQVNGVVSSVASAATMLLNRTGGSTFGAGVQYQTSGTNNWAVGTGQTTVGTDYQIYNYNLSAGALAISYSTNNVLIGTTTDSGYKLDVSGTGRFTSNLLAQKVQVGTAATINDATGVGNTLQFANYSAGVFVTGSADSYVYKTSSVFGGLAAQTLIFQTRSDVAGGGFAFVGGSTPSAVAIISDTGAATFSSSVTATQGFLTATANTYAGGALRLTAHTGGTQIFLTSVGTSFALSNGGSADHLLIASTGAATFSSTAQDCFTINTTNSDGPVVRIQNSGTNIGMFGNAEGVTNGGVTNFAVRATNNLIFSTGGANPRITILAGGNVGIGTTSPSYKLDILGKVGFNTDGTMLWGNAFDYGKLTWDTGKAIVRGESGKALSLGANGTQDYVYITTTGNVGIGTTSPSFSLSVNRATTATAQFNVNNNMVASFRSSTVASNAWAGIKLMGDEGSGIWFSDEGGTYNHGYISQRYTGQLDFATGTDSTAAATVKMTILSGGNVGINTTNPTAKLEISGFSTGAGLKLNYGNSSGTIEAVNFIANGGANGVIGMQMVSAGVGDLWLGGSGGRTLTLYRDGNVGIGTASPGQKLEVSGSAAGDFAALSLSNTNQSGTADGLTVNFKLGRTVDSFLFTIPAIKFVKEQQWTSTPATVDGALLFSTILDESVNERMRINSAGNVGIGNSSPQANGASAVLDVGNGSGGTLNLRDTNTGLAAEGFNQIFGGDNRMYLYAGGSGASSYMQFYTNDMERMRLTSDGHIIVKSTTSGGGTQGDFYVIENGGLVVDASEGATQRYIEFTTGGTSKMVITAAGNVAIGATSTSYKLDVIGTQKIGSTAISQGLLNIVSTTTGTSDIFFSDDTDNRGVVRYDHTSDFMSFWSAGSERMRINSAGRLIIGRTTDSGSPFNLQVDGRILQTGTEFLFEGDNDKRITVYAARPLIFATTDTERMRIQSNGDVYIRNTTAAPTNGQSLPGSFYFEGYGWNTSAGSENIQGRINLAGEYSSSSGSTEPALVFSLKGSGGGNVTPAGPSSLTERMRITNYGNVGIGTTSPGAKLDVNGEVYVSPNTAGKNTFVLTTNASNDGRLLIKSDTTTKVDIQANGTTYFNGGNVGIGTTSPLSKQQNQIEANGSALFLVNAVGGGGAYVDLDFNTYNPYQVGYANPGATIRVIDDGAYSGHITFRTKGASIGAAQSERMRITGTGNVGIGTTAPLNRFAVIASNTFGYYNSSAPIAVFQGVNPTLLVANDNNTDDAASEIRLGNAQTSYYTYSPYIRALQGGGIDNYRLEFGTSNFAAATTRMTITAAGNVGIGTTSPTLGLHVADGKGFIVGPSGASGSMYVSPQDENTVNGGYGIAEDTADIWLNYRGYQDGFSYFRDTRIGNGKGTAIVMVDGSAGNVGIGTTSPSYKLDVVGDARITSGSLGVGVAPNATDGRIDASNDIVAYQTSDQRLKENVTPIENALEKVKSLTGVEFDWIEEHKHIHGYEGHDTGIIAQQVQAVMPTAVRTNDSGYLSVRYEKMIALLIEGMKEQQNQIDELKAKLDDLTR